HVQLIASPPDEQHRSYRLDGPDTPNRDAQWIFERFARLFVECPEDLFDGSAHGIFQSPARQLLCDRIDVVDCRMSISRDDAVTDRLQGDLRALLFAEE